MAQRTRRYPPAIDRLLNRIVIDPETECWLWLGALTGGGYGAIGVNGRQVRTHRLSYEHFVGSIPEGLQLDHLCRVRRCCCPWHLEAVTPGENIRRGDTGKTQRLRTHCLRGHPYDDVNTYRYKNKRLCRACRKVWDASRTRKTP